MALASQGFGAEHIRKRDVALPMLVCFSFECKPEMEQEFAEVLADPEMAHRIALAMGATRNTLFMRGRLMVRVFDFPDGVAPVPLMEVARNDEAVATFLRRLAPLLVEPYDLNRPESMDAFNKRNRMPLVYDVKA